PYGFVEVLNGNTAICRGELASGFKQIGQGTFMTSAGLIAIADTPMSLVGAILTFPIASARSNEYPWATWWGEKSIRYSTTSPPTPDRGDQRIHGGIEPSERSPNDKAQQPGRID